MATYILEDAFWHPRLGIVLCYVFAADHGVHTMNDRRVIDLRVRTRDYILPYPECAEDEAPEFLAWALGMDKGSGGA